jgi:hypothetical protein
MKKHTLPKIDINKVMKTVEGTDVRRFNVVTFKTKEKQKTN